MTPTPHGISGDALKPCPFCGSDAGPEEGSHAAIGAAHTVTIYCNGCHASSATELSYADAAKAWNTRPTPPPVGVSGGLVERLRDQPCAEGTGVCGKCAGCVGYEAAGAITQLEADKAELRAALAEAHAALTDPCIGTYDQDDLDWYRKVDAAVKRIAPLTTGKSHSYEKASKG